MIKYHKSGSYTDTSAVPPTSASTATASGRVATVSGTIASPGAPPMCAIARYDALATHLPRAALLTRQSIELERHIALATWSRVERADRNERGETG